MSVPKEWVPVLPGLFTFDGCDVAKIRILGSRCRQCGEKYFPTRSNCPRCSATDLEGVTLSSTGVITNYTVVRQTAPTWKGPVPYIIVVVQLDDGGKVTTHLIGSQPEEVRVGARVRAVAGKLWDDEQGRTVLANMFELSK